MNKTSHVDLAELTELAHIIAEADGPEPVFAAVAEAANRHIGHKLFTIMAFDAASMRVQRLYSNNPEAYPPGGAKAKRDTEWSRHVLEQGSPFIGHSAEDIRANFDDHDVIFGLGLESILNMPVRLQGKTIGTMNLLHEAAFYDTSDLVWGSFLAAQLAGSLSLVRQ